MSEIEINKKEENADSKKPLPEQQAAIDSIKNTVVAAGAGSGKTTVLSLRFLNLVQKYRYNVDEILTLTFTKKATVEMSDRIYKVLKEKEKEQAANFYKANIKTLDSYCNSIAKQGCRYYGISPDFIQDDDFINDRVKAMSLAFLLEHRNNKALQELIRTDDCSKIAEGLFAEPVLKYSTVCEPIDFREDLVRQYDAVVNEWNKSVLELYTALHDQQDFLDNYEGNKSNKFYVEHTKVFLDNGIPEMLTISFEDVENSDYEICRDFLLNLSVFTSFKMRVGNAKGLDDYKEAMDIVRKKNSVLISLANYIKGVKYVKELIPLFEKFQYQVMNLKRKAKCLTFKDVSSMALCILRDHPEIRLLEKKKYKAIMIDEFQDNNKDQRDLLFLLAEKIERMEKGIPSTDELIPEKLFFVGDEKQSIYRFRGADVEVFNRLSEDFKDGNLQMYTNHRSHPELIAAFNTIFGGERYTSPAAGRVDFAGVYPPSVFYNERQAAKENVPPYEAVYHNVQVPDYKKNVKIECPRIHLAFYEPKDDVEANVLVEEEAEIEWIARKIEEKIAEGVNPSDIAVLMRNTASQPVFERIFLRHGIPYNADSVKDFFADGPVCDIISYLTLCIYENDRFSYMQVLLSPFVNLNLIEAEALLSLNEKPFEGDYNSLLEKESAERFLKAKKYFEETKEFIRENSIAESISRLWYGFGYRYETMWNHVVMMYGKLYDLLFELACKADQKNENLAMFLDEISEQKNDSNKLEVSVPLEKAEGVQIMTIHKSKGLEFKIVFVPNIHKKSSNDKNDKPVYFSRKYGMSVNTPVIQELSEKGKSNYFYDSLKDREKKCTQAELRRLVYVALTRAVDELYITNGKKKNDKETQEYLPGGNKNPDTIYQILEPVIDFYLKPDENNNTPFADASPFCAIEWIPEYKLDEVYSGKGRPNTEESRVKLAVELTASSPYESAEILKKEEDREYYILPSKLHEKDDETAVKSEGGRVEIDDFDESAPFAEINSVIERHSAFGYADFGTIAHAYMESTVNGTEGNEPFSHRDISGLDGSDKDLSIIKAACEKMRSAFKESRTGKEALSSGWKKAEYPFRSRIGNKIIKGTMDLVYEKEDGTFVIIDFKTNTTVHPEIYYDQLACYRQALCQMMGVEAEKVKCALYYLRFGREVDITEECNKINLEKAVEKFETN
jgi:ATP-dependent helicase/nuclease subunit A